MKKIEKLSKDWSYFKKKRKKNNEDCRISEYSHRFKKKNSLDKLNSRVQITGQNQ